MKELTKIGNYEIALNYLYYDQYIWAKRESDTELKIGLTDYGQKQLKDIINIEFPEKLQRIAASTTLVIIESIFREYTMKSPVSCIILDINTALNENPELINNAPYESWIILVEVVELSQLDTLMDGEDMADLLADEVPIEIDDDANIENEDFDYEKDLYFDSGNDYYNDDEYSDMYNDDVDDGDDDDY